MHPVMIHIVVVEAILVHVIIVETVTIGIVIMETIVIFIIIMIAVTVHVSDEVDSQSCGIPGINIIGVIMQTVVVNIHKPRGRYIVRVEHVGHTIVIMVEGVDFHRGIQVAAVVGIIEII